MTVDRERMAEKKQGYSLLVTGYWFQRNEAFEVGNWNREGGVEKNSEVGSWNAEGLLKK